MSLPILPSIKELVMQAGCAYGVSRFWLKSARPVEIAALIFIANTVSAIASRIMAKIDSWIGKQYVSKVIYMVRVASSAKILGIVRNEMRYRGFQTPSYFESYGLCAATGHLVSVIDSWLP